MKVACIIIPEFFCRAELRRSPLLKDYSIIVVTTYGSKRTVEAFSSDLTSLRVGMSLQEALTEVKEVQILESDKFYYNSLFQDILRFQHLSAMRPVQLDLFSKNEEKD